MSAPDRGEWPASHLTVTILQARRLRPKDRHGGSNPYVQVQLGNHSFTTHTPPKTICPVWNDAVTFVLPAPRDDALVVTLTVMHRRALPLPDRFLGRAEVRLEDVCQNHQPVCTRWLTLESKPKKKVKDRGEMEVTFCLANLHSSSSLVGSQLSSICGASHGGWGSTQTHGPSSVQPAEEPAPIQPSCAVAPVLDRAPPSVAEHTHERAASPACVSSGVGNAESSECTAQSLDSHSRLREMTSVARNETTADKVSDCKAGVGTLVASKGVCDPPMKNSISSTATQTTTPTQPLETSSTATGQATKLLLRLGYMIRRLQYRWGLGANRGETQPLHVPGGHPEDSAQAGKGVSEDLEAQPRGLRVLWLWVLRCLGKS